MSKEDQYKNTDPIAAFSVATDEVMQKFEPSIDFEGPEPLDPSTFPEDVEFLARDCSIMWTDRYHRPNINIGGSGRIRVELGPRVTHASLRHVESGARRIYRSGHHRVPTGLYVLSLRGDNFGRRSIRACVHYTRD